MFACRIKQSVFKSRFKAEEKGKEKDYDMSLAVGSRSKC